MENGFSNIKPEEITENVFKLLGNDWMLLTTGNLQKNNTMTASWGGFGVIWKKKVCFCAIRPQRYTYEMMERTERFTLSFFDERYRDVLNYCGKVSGRDVDKIAESGLTPMEGTEGTVYFKEAKLVIECRKVYFQDIDPENFVDSDIEKNYPNKDYHRMYTGEIIGCYCKNV